MRYLGIDYHKKFSYGTIMEEKASQMIEDAIVGLLRSKRIVSIATSSGLKTSEIGDMVVETLSNE